MTRSPSPAVDAAAPPGPGAGPVSWALVILSAIVATLPLEVTKRVMPVEWLELSRLVMLVAFAWLARDAIRRGRGLLAGLPREILVATTALIALDLVSVALTRWPAGPKELATIVVYAGLALFVATVLTTRRRFAVLGLWALVAGAVVGLVSIVEQVGDVYLWMDHPIDVLNRRNSTFSDPNITARFFLITLAVAIAAVAVRRRRSRVETIAILSVVAVLTAGLVFTLSRTGWALLAVELLAFLPVLVRKPAGPHAVLLPVIGLTFVGLLLLNANAMSRATDLPPAESQVQLDESVDALPVRTTLVGEIVGRVPLDLIRRYLIRAGAVMFEDHPLTGVGVGGFPPEILGPYRNYIPAERRPTPVSLQHTDAVRIAAETGLIGLIAFLGLLVAVASAIRRAGRGASADDRIVLRCLAVIVLVILLSAQMEGRFYTEPYLWVAIGAIGAFSRLLRIEREGAADGPVSPAATGIGPSAPAAGW